MGSEMCIRDSCIPKEDKKYRMVLGIWALVIAIIGILGNILTLLAIPYAARKKRYIIINYITSNKRIITRKIT